MTSLPIPVTVSNLDFVLARTPEIVFLRFPDGADDEPVYRNRAREVLGVMLELVKPRVVYHGGDQVFAIEF